MKNRTKALLALMAVGAMAIAPAAAASATQYEGKKVTVCKYVGTPGVDEEFSHTITVSKNTLKGWDGETFPFEFPDAHGNSVAIGWQGTVSDSDCPPAEGPPEKPNQPEPLTGTESEEGREVCVEPLDGTAVITNRSREWMQEYVWDEQSWSWVLGDKAYSEWVDEAVTIDSELCEPEEEPEVPEQPAAEFGANYRSSDPACTDPLDGTAYVINEEQSWTQEYVWDAEAWAWVLGERVYGEWAEVDRTVSEVENCSPDPEVPEKPEPIGPSTETTATEWEGPEPTCEEPDYVETRTVTTVTTTYEWVLVNNEWVSVPTVGEPVITTEYDNVSWVPTGCEEPTTPEEPTAPEEPEEEGPAPTSIPASDNTPRLAETGGSADVMTAFGIGALFVLGGTGLLSARVLRKR